jgi:3-methyladenine DNA glycosylase AlkD
MCERITSLTDMLESHQNENKAIQMSAYMKGKFSFYGIPAPVRNDIQKIWFPIIKEFGFDFWELIHTLWGKEEREFQMIAVDLMKKRPAKQMEIEDIDQLEFTISTKSWWDTVDLIASNYLGVYFQKFPEQIAPITEKWIQSNNMWLQRSCLIFQLKYKEKTDFKRLTQYIKELKHIDEFFIQKAIGWSLRQYSKFSPEEVSIFIDTENIQGLARKEASNYLN